MQRFCHVDAGIVDADVFAFAYVLIAVRFAVCHGLFDYALVVGLFVKSEIEISRHGFRFSKQSGRVTDAASSSAMAIGDFLRAFENLKQGRQKSPILLSLGGVMRAAISAEEMPSISIKFAIILL